MTEWELKRAATKAELKKLAESIIVALIRETEKPWQYVATENDECCKLTSDNGAALWLSNYSYNKPDRLTISGIYPHTKSSYNSEPRPEIGVAKSRGAEKIAQEIKRRLLPQYYGALTKATEASRREAEYERQKQATADLLAKALGEKRNKNLQGFAFNYSPKHDGYGSITVNSPDSVSCEFKSVPVALALRLVATVQEFDKQYKETA